MSEKISITELQTSDRFEKVLEIKHQDILPFIFAEFQRKNLIIRIFWIINLMILVFSLLTAVFHLWNGTIHWAYLLGMVLLGAVLGSSLIIPIHEWIHGLAYYLMGAQSVSYGWNLKQLYFYAVANEFITDAKSIWIIALSPFVFITFFCFLTTLYVIPLYQWLFIGVILMHSLNCAGDFGILSYFWANKESQLYTYDDVEASVSYVFKAVN